MARTFSVPIIGQSAASGAQVIDGSLKFDEDKNTYLKVTPGSNGNRRTWTWSGWVKRNTFGSSLMSRFFMGGTTSVSTGNAVIAFYQDRLFWQIGSSTERITTNRVFRDTGWYHIVVALDTTLASDYGTSERVKIYVNGKQEHSFSTSGYPGQNLDSGVNSTQGMLLGAGRDSSGNEPDGPFDGQISNVYLIDGLQLGPGYFGFTDPLTGIWKPKKFRAKGTTVNDGRTFSSTGTFSNWDDDGTYPKTKLFDGQTYAVGNATPNGASSDSSSEATFDFGDRQITGFQNLKVNIFLSSNQASATNVVSVNGVDITQDCHRAGNNQWTTVDLGNKFTTLKSFRIANNNIYVGGFFIDGVIMKDSTTTNLSFGTNGFYLPLDGSASIGQDQSGQGNNLTPQNFGGSAGVDQATGALPILEGAGGAVAGVGVRTDNTPVGISTYLTLALPLVGNAYDVSNRINSGSTTKTVTVSGDPASSTLESNFYGASFYFDGSANTDYVSVADNDQLDVGSGDFTIECWAYVSGYPNTNPGLLSKRGGNGAAHWQLVLNRNGQIQFGDQSTWSNYFGTSSGTTGDTIFKDNWHHIALTRTSGSVQAWYDGRKYGDAISNTTDFSTSANFSVGVGREDNYDPFQGYVNDVRVYKGVAKYTSDFIPASTNPDILPDTPSGVAGGSKLAKIIDGAVSFEGTATSKLTVADSSDFTFGTNDFCIEFYYYNKAFDGTYDIIFDCMGSNRSGIQLAIETDNDYRIEVGDGSNNWIWQSTGFDSKARRWTHFALTREGSTFRAFENGVLLGTQTSSTAVGDPRSSAIGGYASDDSTNYGFNGFISNFRIVNGSAVYTAAFTPPTAPLTNVTNTKLLCCQETKGGGGAAVSPTQSGFDTSASWSSTAIQNNPDADRPIQHLFDGTTSNIIAAPSGNNATNRIDLGRSITATTSLRFYLNAGGYNNGKVTVFNGATEVGSVTAESSQASGFYSLDVGTFPLTFTAVQVSRSSGGTGSGMSQIEVDSSILKDPAARFGGASATYFNPFNTDINTVRGQETGYPTLNPLIIDAYNHLSENNLKIATTSNFWEQATSTIGVKSGKWYWEVLYVGTNTLIGATILPNIDGGYMGQFTGSYGRDQGGGYYVNGSNGSGRLSWSSGSTIGVALDMDNGEISVYPNGIYESPFATNLDTSQVHYAGVSVYGNTSNTINFGQKPFKFPPPDGFQPLNDANVRPSKVISRPDQYVGIVTWKGNATSGREITGLNFNDKPDLIWIKNRDESIDHTLYDSIRGFGANKELTPNGQYSEGQTGVGNPNSNAWGYVNSNTRNGFVINNGSSGQSLVNNNNIGYVAWCWKAGGNSGNFNIDHVGYSTAGDAAMSVGDQNNVGYNTDQNWGSGATGEINPGGGALESGCFNGNFSDNINSYWGDTSKAITYTFNNLPFKKLRFYAVGSNISNSYVRFNGVAQTQAKIGLTNLKFGWFDAVDVPSPLNKIEVYTAGSSDFLSLYAVEVDGKILVNSNVTPPNLPSIPATGASVGTEQGFSIVTYTGTGSAGTIPHRLTQDPEFVIFKGRNFVDDWRVWHKDLDDDEPQDYYMILQSTNARSSDQNQSFMNRVPPTGPVIHLGTDSAINGSTRTMVAYSWHSVPGLQKFGKYSGNSNADGPYIELGFRPALLLVRRLEDAGNQWLLFDSERTKFNQSSNNSAYIRIPDTGAEGTANNVDFLSNGFKWRKSDSYTNDSASSIGFMYAAWAEAPSVNLYGGGANAR
jgi:hypothetical protein